MQNLDDLTSFETWSEIMWRFASPMRVSCENPEDFKGLSKTWELGTLSVTYFSAPPYSAEQTDLEMHKAQRKRLVLTIPVWGACEINQYGRHVTLRPGEAAFHVTKSPLLYRQTEATTAWIFSIPLQTALMYLDDPEEVCAIKIDGKTPGYSLVTAFLDALLNDFLLLSESVRNTMAQCATTMICALAQQFRGQGINKRSQIGRQRLRLIKGSIDMRLGDHELSPKRIAEDNDISTRYLHYLFKTDGSTVSKYVREKRLETSARFITDNINKRLDVADVAQRFGFSSAVQFRRQFSARYGASPAKFGKLTHSAQQN